MHVDHHILTALAHLSIPAVSSSQVALGHMSCLVEDTGGEQRVTFLYKLAPGPCPKSFGINVARLAQLPDAVSNSDVAEIPRFEVCVRSTQSKICEKSTEGAPNPSPSWCHHPHPTATGLSLYTYLAQFFVGTSVQL